MRAVRGLRFSVKRLDGAALAGGVAALEDDDDALAGGAEPGLELDELELAGVVGLLVFVVVEPLLVGIARVEDVVLVGVLERLADRASAPSSRRSG